MITLFDEFILESKDSVAVVCYHKSNEYRHMVNADFKLERSSSTSHFGRAIYFSEQPNIGEFFGKYSCKFSIKMDKPILNLNKRLTNKGIDDLIKLYNKSYNKKIEKDFLFFRDNQFGEFFESIRNMRMSNMINSGIDWKSEDNSTFGDFIKNKLGFNSFKYLGNKMTDFVTDLTTDDCYGWNYGIYNPKNIKFLNGPFEKLR